MATFVPRKGLKQYPGSNRIGSLHAALRNAAESKGCTRTLTHSVALHVGYALISGAIVYRGRSQA